MDGDTRVDDDVISFQILMISVLQIEIILIWINDYFNEKYPPRLYTFLFIKWMGNRRVKSGGQLSVMTSFLYKLCL